MDLEIELVQSSYSLICEKAAKIGLEITPEEMAVLASDYNMGESEFQVLLNTFAYLEERQKHATIETLLRLSRLPRKEPKTFRGFDFDRLQGKDVEALKRLPALADLYARRNIAFIGPGGIGKTHLAQAYGRECCLRCLKTYYIKASELNSRMKSSIKRHTLSRLVSSMVRPSCLIIDEIGRCKFDEDCTNLFFDIVDRRYEKEGPNTLILTSNSVASDWSDFFSGDNALLCALDRIFDKASVFMMRGTSYRGKELTTYSVESKPQVNKQKGTFPIQ